MTRQMEPYEIRAKVKENLKGAVDILDNAAIALAPEKDKTSEHVRVALAQITAKLIELINNFF